MRSNGKCKVEIEFTPYTINTMPEETLQAFGEHGKLGSPLMSNTIDPDGTFADFEKVGFKYEDLAETL